MTATTLAAHPQKAARGVAANLAGAGFAGIAGVAVTWLVAHSLGPTHAGAFFSATAAFVLAASVAKLGTQTGLVYWPAQLRVRGETDLLGACLRAALTPVAATATVVGVIMFVAAPTPELRLLAPFLPIAVLSDCVLAATRGYKQLRPTVLLDRIARPALQLTAIAALALATTSTPAYTLAWVTPYLPVALLAAYALHRIGHHPTKIRPSVEHLGGSRRTNPPSVQHLPPQAVPAGQGSLAARAALGVGRAFWVFTWPRAIASVLQAGLQRVDVLLVAGIAGLPAAAVYAVAGRFVVLGQFANQAITQAIQPRLAERLASNDTEGANALYQTATGWLVLATWPLYLVVATNASAYLGVFGHGYRDGADVVIVLAGAMMVATGCGMVDVVLSMAGRTLWNLGNVGLALAAMVGIDLVVIPRFGALGAAVGLATAVVANNLLPLAQIGYALRLHPFGRGTCVAATMAASCFGVLPNVLAQATGTGPAARLGGLAAATAAYLAAAHRLRHPLALDAFTALRRPG
jgi:O-antigen/teichoic acid export membrane protein